MTDVYEETRTVQADGTVTVKRKLKTAVVHRFMLALRTVPATKLQELLLKIVKMNTTYWVDRANRLLEESQDNSRTKEERRASHKSYVHAFQQSCQSFRMQEGLTRVRTEYLSEVDLNLPYKKMG